MTMFFSDFPVLYANAVLQLSSPSNVEDYHNPELSGLDYFTLISAGEKCLDYHSNVLR